MTVLAPMDKTAARTSLVRDARRLAEEIENLYISLAQSGALAAIRRHMVIHKEGYPSFDLLQAAKALRCYAGVLCLFAAPTASSKPTAGTDKLQ